MSRRLLDELFSAARAERRAVLLPYLTAGIPDPATSIDLFVAMAEAGADGFEVGIPYADPLMDGPVIQEAGRRALAAGVSLERGLDLLGRVVEATGRPVLAMSYVNPILRIGAAEFAGRVREAGAAGVIVADLPVDEAGDIATAVAAAGLGMVLFVAPTTTDARLALVADADPVFIYGVADLGVTGERAADAGRIGQLASRVRAVTSIPLVAGVGISTPPQARRAATVADGVIVGSALVRRVLEASPGEAVADLRAATAEFAAALRD